MLSMSVKIDTPKLTALLQALSAQGRAALYDGGSAAMLALTQRHVREASVSRHKTADGMRPSAATPTNALELAADTAEREWDGDGMKVRLAAPGIGRVLHPLTIVPRIRSALTIPVHTMAYGRRASEVPGLFRPRAKGGRPANYLATADEAGNVVPMFVLVTRAVIPQDREIAPSDRAYRSAAIGGILATIKDIQGRAQ